MKFFNNKPDIYTILCSILLIIEILHYLRVWIEPITANRISKYMSWRKFDHLIQKMAKEIKKDNKQYGMIVSVGRGGAICAGCLSSYLNSIPILVLDREYIIENGTRKAIFYESGVTINSNYSHLKNKNVLLLSQQSDPGITLKEIEKIMTNSGFTNLEKCAVLKSDKTADSDIIYCGKKYSSDKKCKKYPWEKHKGYKDIMI